MWLEVGMTRMLLEVAGVGLFTLLAVLLPRDREQRVINPDLIINVLTENKPLFRFHCLD